MSSNGGGIKYIEHQDIDYKKWDLCIESAGNSRVYAMSWHLDRTAEVWDALVWGDYDVVMPLPHRKKWGIKYLYQPFYSQQLGIFPNPAPEIAAQFYKNASSYFRYLNIQTNSSNPPPQNLMVSTRKNHLLPLNIGYKSLAGAYSKNTRRNIAKANRNHLNFVEGTRLEEFLAFKEKNLAGNTSKSVIKKLKSIIAYSQYKGIGEITGIYSPSNELCAAVYFCRWKERLIYLNAVSSSEGKKLRAMFYLLDQLLQTSAGKNLVIDFEGSVIPGIARFFEGFGATPETYYQLFQNKLPFPLNKF